MKQAYIEINEVPTVVNTWGRWIEQKSGSNKEDIIIFIPGNPGLPGYYKKFLKTLYDKLQCSVWIIGHAGHQEPNPDSYIIVPKLKNNEKLFSLQGQIDHKLDFFRKYVPSNARVHLIGHSIGSYICLNLMKHSDIKSKVASAYLLFPAIENMLETSNGKFLFNIIQPIVPIIVFLSWIFTCFPRILQRVLLYVYCKITSMDVDNIPPTIELIKPAVLQRIFYMGIDEMHEIKNLNPELINNSKEKIKLYYGACDNWAPVSYCKRLMQIFPELDVEICTRKFNHAFVLNCSENVGNMVASWIQLEN